ncbi:adenylate/guanylate cyclase domain-containing protein [Domibacillus tundrae]|uniref:adenylate/guanylate cyclase domain-containing protein n=1 Tax=Domibacillus tundrae TaxID=1587527 RepID=UPI003396C18F
MPKEKTYRFQKVYSLPRAEVWKLLSDTDHLNRVTGLFPVQFTDAQFKDQSMFRYAETKVLALVPIKWREYPFEWIKEERYSVERVYEGGPLERVLWTIECKDVLMDGQTATEVTGTAHFTKRNILGQAAISLIALPSLKKIIMNYLGHYIKDNTNRVVKELPQEKTSYIVYHERFSRLLDQLRTVYPHEGLADCLENHLTMTGDDEVLHMKPYRLAAKWGYARQEVLDLFLHATKIGLLTQSWNLMCPNCRVPKQTVSSLSEVGGQVHCDLCGVGYDMNFDRYVEMRFSVHPSVRQATDQTYCVAGPLRSPHIFAQYRLKPYMSQQVYYPPLPPGSRIRTLKTNHAMDITSGVNQTLTYSSKGWTNQSAGLSPNGGIIGLHNDNDEERVVVFETTAWDAEALTAADATTSQLFRDLFSKEVLALDQQIGVESLTILFSDLRGSTAMYERVGDAKAYRHVHRHFDFLRRHIAAHNGAIVKTIGDSVMAAFYKPDDALRAALAIQSESAVFNESQGMEVIIKIGLFTGPTIAVNANELLDYFGHTVNMAARVQQQSEGGDIMISAEEWERESFAQAAEGYEFEVSRSYKKLSGIQNEVNLVQLTHISVSGSLAV